jgi:hypothetical protein
VADDPMDVIQNHLANFVVGLVRRVDGAGSQVIGSGVLVSIDDRRGILTCGHVADVYKDLPDIGLVRLVSGKDPQRRIVDLSDAQHVIVHSSEQWTETDLDLAFTFLAPEVASSIAAQSVFLNLEKNRERVESGEPPDSRSVDIMFGLVEEYSGIPVKEGGVFISPMRAVIYRGNMHSEENCLLRFQTIADDTKLPKSFGGLSGSGLWRVNFSENEDGTIKIIEHRLWGITSWQIDKEKNRGAVAGQGWDRIEQGLITTVRENFPR